MAPVMTILKPALYCRFIPFYSFRLTESRHLQAPASVEDPRPVCPILELCIRMQTANLRVDRNHGYFL